MSNEPEWRDATPKNENLPNKGKIVIQLIAGGIALIVIAVAGRVVRPLGLITGGFAFMSGLMMLVRRRQVFYKPGLIVTACGFLLLLANPRFGVVAGFAGWLVFTVAIGLVAFGLFKAVMLAWDVGKGV